MALSDYTLDELLDEIRARLIEAENQQDLLAKELKWYADEFDGQRLLEDWIP